MYINSIMFKVFVIFICVVLSLLLFSVALNLLNSTIWIEWWIGIIAIMLDIFISYNFIKFVIKSKFEFKMKKSEKKQEKEKEANEEKQ